MKIKITQLFIYLICTISAFGQLQKGNSIIGGTATFQAINIGDDSDALIIINPSLNYFVSDRLALGGSLFFGSILGSTPNFGLSGQGRLYLSNQEKAAWFLNAELGFLTFGDGALFNGNAGLGIDVFLSPYFAWESTMSLGFQEEDSFISGNSTILTFGTGFRFFFNRFPEEPFENRNGILEKGNLFLGTSFGTATITRFADNTSTAFNLNPIIGKFLTKNWVLGANVQLTSTSFSNLDLSSFQAQLSPFVRYYANGGERKAVLFLEAGGGLSIFRINDDFFDRGTEFGPIFFAGLGFDFFVSPAIAFEIKGGYNFIEQSDFISQKTLALNFGFQYFLGK